MLSQITSLEILVTEDLTPQEIDHLIDQLEVTRLANEKFCKGEISFADYLDCLEVAEVDIDDYLIGVEENLHEAGIIV